MSKMKLFKQAEQMYLKGSTVSKISLELGIAKRTLFYWKKQYDWDKKRQESMYNKSQFKEDLQKFAQKLMDKIANSNKTNSQISQAEYYSLVNILNFLPELKENNTQNETPQIKTELSSDFICQIEREILGIE
uniref:terminase gpP N-terminus-related DNA-binding protein n=1 Tax=Candidatus Stercorousia sp. TaxID=3048886 RepID=UPI0040270C00